MQQWRLAMQLGWRFSRSKHSNGFITFISASSVLGIALGCMVLIVVLSAMNGFERELRDRLLSVIPHGELTAVYGTLDDWPALVEQVQAHSQVMAAAPAFTLTAMAESGNKLKAVALRGVEPELEVQVSEIANMLKLNKWSQLSDGNYLILGSALAKELDIQAGDKVNLLYSAPASDGRFRAPKRFVFTLLDTFEVGGQIDGLQGYVSLDNARRMVGVEQGVGSIRLKVADIYDAPMIVREVAMQVQQRVYMHDWTRTQGHLYKDIQLVRMVMWVVLFLVVAVACFNIVSTLVMSVKEKRGDIAILMTMGLQRAGIIVVFSIQGMFNGVLGSVIGCALGTLIAANLSDLTLWLEQLFSRKLLSEEVYFINYIPSQLNMGEVWWILIIAMLLSFFATIYPAIQATRVQPAEQLGNQ